MKRNDLIDKNKKKNFLKFIKNKIIEDFNIKLICFALALAAFLIISFIQRGEKVFTCNLKITGLKENLVVSNVIQDTIRITVKDKQYNLDKITEADFNVRLDLSNITTTNNYKIKLDWDLPKSMQSVFNSLLFSSVELNPDEIDVNIEKLIEKNIPIAINSIGSVSKGFTLKKKTMDAYYVRIQGPEKIVNDIKYIETERINIEGEIESFRRNVNLITPSSLIKLIGRTKVEVYFEIAKDLEFKTYRFDKVSVHNLKNSLKILNNENYNFIVQISGTREDILKLKKDNIILSVDCSKVFYPGEYLFRIDVGLPNNINLNSINPDVVKFNIENTN